MPPVRSDRRRQPATWPWLAGGAIVIALLWFLFARPDPTVIPPIDDALAPDSAPPAAPEPVPVIPPAVAQFVALVEAHAHPEAVRDKQYAADALRRLAVAIEEVAAQRGIPELEVQQYASIIHVNADSVQERTGDFANSRRVHAAFGAASAAIQRMRGPQLQDPPAAPLPDPTSPPQLPPQAEETIDRTRALSEQGESVQRFLERMAAALRSIAETTRAVAAR